jgi:hypothetical protein
MRKVQNVGLSMYIKAVVLNLVSMAPQGVRKIYFIQGKILASTENISFATLIIILR